MEPEYTVCVVSVRPLQKKNCISQNKKNYLLDNTKTDRYTDAHDPTRCCHETKKKHPRAP